MSKLNENHSIDLSLTRAYRKPIAKSVKDVFKKVRYKNLEEENQEISSEDESNNNKSEYHY